MREAWLGRGSGP